jgi:hypothetical protein
MPKNLDYTGLVRTPRFLTWRIRARSVLKDRLERRKKDLAALPKIMCEMGARLAALDQVFPAARGQRRSSGGQGSQTSRCAAHRPRTNHHGHPRVLAAGGRRAAFVD